MRKSRSITCNDLPWRDHFTVLGGGEHLKDKILRSLETAAEARTGKQTVVLTAGMEEVIPGKSGSMGRKKKEINLLIAKRSEDCLKKKRLK